MRSIPQYEVYTSIRCIYLNTLQIPKLLVMGLWSWDFYFHGGRIAVQFRIAVKLGSVKLGLAKFWLWEWDEVRCSGWSSWPAKKNAVMRKMYSRSKKKELEKIKAPTFRDSGLFLFVDVWPWPGPWKERRPFLPRKEKANEICRSEVNVPKSPLMYGRHPSCRSHRARSLFFLFFVFSVLLFSLIVLLASASTPLSVLPLFLISRVDQVQYNSVNFV